MSRSNNFTEVAILIKRWARPFIARTRRGGVGFGLFLTALLAGSAFQIWAGGFETRAEAAGGTASEFAVVPQTPAWIALPALQVRVADGAASPGLRLWAAPEAGAPWQEITLSDGAGRIPFPVPDAAALWGVRFRVESKDPAAITVEPAEKLALVRDPAQNNPALPGFLLSNWEEGNRVTVGARDADGLPVSIACLDGPNPCQEGSGAYDLGFLPFAAQASLLVLLPPGVRYPVTLTARDGSGDTVSAVVPGRAEAAPVGLVNYYGLTPATNYTCTPTPIADATKMVITAVLSPVTYTLYNLTDGVTFATGALASRGDQVTINSLTDDKAWKLATSQPVQAYMGYDCSGTLPGSMFYLADDGLLNYGTAFTVPFANWETSGTPRLQYWVFATGAGRVTVKTLGGTTMRTNDFSDAGAWQIDLTTSPALSRNTVYLVTFSPTAPGATIAVMQSSQNAATDVPATTQMADACSVTNVGRQFYTHVQQWNGDARIAAFAYEGTGSGTITATNLSTGTVYTLTTTASTGNAYLSEVLPAGPYRVDSTVNIGVLSGSPEGGTNLYDIGDDAYYFHGDGTDVRGPAMRCGGAVFVAQDGTEVAGVCTPASPCGLPPITNPYDADAVLTLSGNTSDTNLFDLKTQDAQHTLLVEVFGGNCSTSLNDWSKVLQPASLGRPPVAYPLAGSPLLSTTPTVVGTALPGAIVKLYISPPPPGTPGTQVLLGQATADSGGNWNIPYPTGTYAPLTPGVTYSFDAVQSIAGACSVVDVPPVGSSGSSGVIDVDPPIVVAPANGSSTTNSTPPITGTAPPDTTVTVYIDGAAAGTAPVDAGGNWSYTPATALSLGSHTVYAIAEDGAGNTSAASNTNTFSVVAPSPYIVKTSSANPGYASPGQTITYTIAVTNSTASTWTNVAVTDPLPPNTIYVPGSTQVTYPVTQSGYYMDQFSSIAYTGSNGTLTWPSSSPWVEGGDDNNVSGGDVRVVNDTAGNPSSNALRLDNSNNSASRAADLSSWQSGTVSFNYRRSGTNGGDLVTVRLYDGVSWSTLTTIAGGTNETIYKSFTSPPIASNFFNAGFQIRFATSNGTDNGNYFYFDNIQISLAKTVSSTVPGGDPPNLASGYTLLPGQSLTVTFQATVDPNLSNTVGSISNTATVTATGLADGPWSSTATDPVLPAPVVTTPADGSVTSDTTPTIAGTVDSSIPVGSTVTVNVDGTPHTTTVQADHTWTLDWPTSLSLGPHSVYATVGVGGAVSPRSDTHTFTVGVASTPPIVTASLLAGSSQTIYGSSVEAAGSTITVYKNGASVGTTTVNADGSWSLAGVTLAANDQVKATVEPPGKAASGYGNTVVVSAGASSVTPPPAISYPVAEFSTSVTGTTTAPVNSVIDVYADGVYLGSTVYAGGTWTLSGLSPLASGTILTATATAPCPTACAGTSDWSGPVLVGSMLMLLRSDAMTSLTQNRAPIFVYPVAQPPYPSLQPLGPNHVFNSTEGATGGQPSAPGTSDDDKAYIRDIHSGDVDPDAAVLTDNGRPLVFYELMDNNQKILKLSKTADGKIQFTITP